MGKIGFQGLVGEESAIESIPVGRTEHGIRDTSSARRYDKSCWLQGEEEQRSIAKWIGCQVMGVPTEIGS